MLTKRIKLAMVACLLSGILLCILGCTGMEMMTPQALKYPRGARKSVVITIDKSQRSQLFDQLRKFSDKYGFTILIDAQSSGPEDFYISINGGDIEIDGANPFAPGEYHLGFYDIDHLHSAPESVFDDLVSELESFVSEVPSATFSIEK